MDLECTVKFQKLYVEKHIPKMRKKPVTREIPGGLDHISQEESRIYRLQNKSRTTRQEHYSVMMMDFPPFVRHNRSINVKNMADETQGKINKSRNRPIPLVIEIPNNRRWSPQSPASKSSSKEDTINNKSTEKKRTNKARKRTSGGAGSSSSGSRPKRKTSEDKTSQIHLGNQNENGEDFVILSTIVVENGAASCCGEPGRATEDETSITSSFRDDSVKHESVSKCQLRRHKSEEDGGEEDYTIEMILGGSAEQLKYLEMNHCNGGKNASSIAKKEDEQWRNRLHGRRELLRHHSSSDVCRNLYYH